MKVVDLRNIFANCNDQLIEISDNRIYYAEEKNEEGHNSLFLLEYNRITRRERILANYILDRPAFVPHFFSFSDVILLLLEDGSSHVELLSIDKITGEERHAVVLSLVGNFSECAALDESRIILFTEEDDTHAELFSEYRRLTGFARVACCSIWKKKPIITCGTRASATPLPATSLHTTWTATNSFWCFSRTAMRPKNGTVTATGAGSATMSTTTSGCARCLILSSPPRRGKSASRWN